MSVTNYIWDEVNDTVLMETNSSGTPTAVYTNEPGQFGGLISERQGGQSQYYHFDAIGSTRQLTNSAGQVTDSYLYDGFGNTVQSTGTSIVPYHFVGCSGYYLDQELAEYYVRARQYSPTLARWLSQDPIGHTGRSANLYDYSRNAPLVIVDPTGLQPIQFPTPIELTPEYVEKMKARCKNIIDNQPPGKLFEPSDLPADQQDCCDKRKNKALKSLLKQPKPTSCNIKVECKKCPSYYSGWTNPPVVKSDGTTDVTVVLCWPTPKGDTFEQIVTHEYTHALQFCNNWNQNLPPCELSMLMEMQAYRNANQCTDFFTCVDRALGSSCRKGNNPCGPGDIDLSLLTALFEWYEKHPTWPTYPQPQSASPGMQ